MSINHLSSKKLIAVAAVGLLAAGVGACSSTKSPSGGSSSATTTAGS